MTAPLSVQLYSLRDALTENPEAVLTKLVEIGFVGVEPYGGLDHNIIAPLCKQLGLAVESAHLPPPIGETQNQTLEAAAAYGIKRMAIPFYPPEQFKTLDDIRRVCDEVNAAQQIAAQNGFELGYHNHWWEFEQLDGQYINEIMLQHLAPEVFFEVDTYWVKVAGQDPASVVAALGSRAPLLHIKDGPANIEQAMTAAGDGVLDIPAIVAAGTAAEWLVVELDRCDTDMMEAVEKSYQYLTAKGLAHGR